MMRRKTLIEQEFAGQREALTLLLERLLALTQETDHTPLIQTVSDLLDRIAEPFLFVIVGEVKSGKSSFINALLNTGRDICAVAPAPMTDTIQQIVFGETEHVEVINPYLKRIALPEQILRDIAIVDTPGTNTIIAHHQEITERFIPGADLIVFVFEAKNPYRQSAWDLFHFIHEDWKKKIIFVLQQKDLLSEEDLQINHAGVARMAKENGIPAPNVFDVSALLELQGDHEQSGFSPLRNYLDTEITGGNAQLLKLHSSADTASNVLGKIGEAIALRKAQYDADVTFRKEIRDSLDQQDRIARNHVNLLVDSLVADYDRIAREKEIELEQVLSFTAVLGRTMKSIFSRKNALKEWLRTFTNQLDTSLSSALSDRMNDRVIDLAESIQQMGLLVDLKIRSSKTILPNDTEIFSDIAERRARVLSDLRDAFRNFLVNSENFTDPGLLSGHERMSPKVFTGSGITVIGVMLAALTNGVVFDITGGVLTTIGVLFTGVTLGIQRRRILRRYREEIHRGRDILIAEISERLGQYIEDIKTRIDANFESFDALIREEGTLLETLTGEAGDIRLQLTDIKRSLPANNN